MLAMQGDEDAEFWVENPVCWAFPWEHSIDLSEWKEIDLFPEEVPL
jgi:hypothetical protein